MVITSHLLSFKVNLTSTNTLEHLQLSSVQNLVTALTLVFIDSKPGQVWGFVFFVGRFFFGGAGGFFSVGGYEWKQSIVSIFKNPSQPESIVSVANVGKLQTKPAKRPEWALRQRIEMEFGKYLKYLEDLLDIVALSHF